MSRNQLTRIITLFLLILFLYLVRGALFPIVAAVILYYILNPLTNILSGKWPKGAGLNRDLAIVVSFVIFVLAILLALQFIIPPFAEEFGQLMANTPQYASVVQAWFDSVQKWQAGIHIPREVNDVISSAIQNLFNFMIAFAQQTANGLLGIISRMVYLVIMPIITYFLLKDEKNIARGALEMVPKDHKDVTMRILKQADEVLKNYITGQLILCSAVGVMCGAGCYALGVKFALMLGMVAAVAQLIPNIGPLIAAVPALIIAAFSSPVLALSVLALYLVVNTLMISVLGPKVLGGKLNLHPLTVVISILIFGELMGVWGFFFAAPIVAMIKILYIELRNP